MLQFTKYKIQNSAHLSKRHLSDVMSSNCFCTVLFPKSSQLFGIRVLISRPNLHGTNVASNSFAPILVSRLCTLDRFQHASLRAFTLRIGYDIILLTCSSHQHATTCLQEIIFCFYVFSLTRASKKTKVAAPFSTQFSRIHTGTCPAVPIAHAATCSLCGVCCCPEHARIL